MSQLKQWPVMPWPMANGQSPMALYTPLSVWPSLSFLVFRYRRVNSEWGDLERERFGHGQAVPSRPTNLRGLFVSSRIDPHVEVAKNLRANAVVALVGLEPEPFVGFDRIEPLVLQLVRANLVGEPDAAAFLVEVEQDATSLGGDPSHGRVELRPAVAPQWSGTRRRSDTSSGPAPSRPSRRRCRRARAPRATPRRSGSRTRES